MPRPVASSLTEKQVRAAVIKRLPILFGKDCYWVSNSPGPWSTSGRPDLEVCPFDGPYRGMFVAIELKAGRYGLHPEDGLTVEQDVTLRRISKAGGICFVANSPLFDSWVRW